MHIKQLAIIVSDQVKLHVSSKCGYQSTVFQKLAINVQSKVAIDEL
jgi:hypothetical protein